MTNSVKSLCPNLYNTDGLFDEVWNSDPHRKCGPRYEYEQSDKALGATATKLNNADLHNYAFRTQQDIQQNGPYDLQEQTGGNMALSRTGVGLNRTAMNIGNKTNDYIFNNRLEGFKEAMNSPDFTTMPTSIQSGMTSGLMPYSKSPDQASNRRYRNVKKSKAMKSDVTGPLNAFKDGLLYSISFGSDKHETFCPFSYEGYSTFGKVMGVIILVLAIWFAISFLISCCLCGRAACCDGCYCPEAWSGISPIYLETAKNNYAWGGNNTNKVGNFFKTVGEVAVCPFVSIYNAITGGTKKQKTTGGLKTKFNILPKNNDDIL